MRKTLTLVLMICTGLVNLNGQITPDSLLSEAEQKLNSGSYTVSGILTDKRYDPIHPETGFRELIKSHCRAEILSISTDSIPGRKIKVTGIVHDPEGRPVTDALVYLYQTDARGWYAADRPHVPMNEGDMRHARLFGYVKTDARGSFELHTIKPSGYPQSDLPAHIHIHIDAEGFRPLVTELLFDDDERLAGNIRQNAMQNMFIISKPEPASGDFEQGFSYKLILRR